MTTRRQLQKTPRGKHRPYFVEEWVTTIVKLDHKQRVVVVDQISKRAHERLRAKEGKTE
jgi:hypothetical protein